jgi:hypothetical protein
MPDINRQAAAAVQQPPGRAFTGEHSKLTGEGALPGSALQADQSEDLHLSNSVDKDVLTCKGHVLKRL